MINDKEKEDGWKVVGNELADGTLDPSEDNDTDGKLWKAIKKDPIITAYTFGLTLGILLWGYDLVIVGIVSSIPAFQ
jgi:hypothetical protein